jgi:hypothetical protein
VERKWIAENGIELIYVYKEEILWIIKDNLTAYIKFLVVFFWLCPTKWCKFRSLKVKDIA